MSLLQERTCHANYLAVRIAPIRNIPRTFDLSSEPVNQSKWADAIQQLSIAIECNQILSECIMVIRGAQYAAGLALVGVLFVFIVPTMDLPDTVKASQVALMAVFLASLLLQLPPDAGQRVTALTTSETDRDQLTRNHALRI